MTLPCAAEIFAVEGDVKPGLVQRISDALKAIDVQAELDAAVKFSVGVDGALLVSDDSGNRIWRVSTTSAAGGRR